KNDSAAKASEPSTTKETDSANAFAASAADQQTDTSKIPDPATFGTAGNNNSKTTAVASANSPVTRPSITTPARSITSGASTASSELHPISPVFVVGVPIAAAILLMGIYWLILRAGAV